MGTHVKRNLFNGIETCLGSVTIGSFRHSGLQNIYFGLKRKSSSELYFIYEKACYSVPRCKKESPKI